MPTVSIAKGKGHARHNDRTIKNKSIEKSWNAALSNRNIVYRNETLDSVYAELFSDSVEKYNAKQVEKGHSERQIDSYLEKITRSKQEKPVYEFIVQIGSIEDKNSTDYEKIQKSLDSYNRSFQTRNPNFKVVQQITHLDEKGMDHTHIMFVPVSNGNKRGLETKNSFSGALQQMGYGRNGFSEWREHETETIKQIMLEHGLEFEIGDGRDEHLNVRQYREYKKYESATVKMQKAYSDVYKRILSDKNKLDGLKLAETKIDAQIAQKRTQIEDLERKKVSLEKNPKKTIVENSQIKSIINDLNNTYHSHKEMESAEFQNDYVDHHDDRALIETLNDDDVTIKKQIFGEPIVQMPLSKWKLVKEKQNKLINALNELRKKFYLGVEKLNNLFGLAIREPEYLNAVDQQKRIQNLEQENSELKSKSKNANRTLRMYADKLAEIQKQNTNEQTALHFLDDVYMLMLFNPTQLEQFKTDLIENGADYNVDQLFKYLDKRQSEYFDALEEKDRIRKSRSYDDDLSI